MKDKCFDIGTIQAFVDGELRSDLSRMLIRHTGVCESCAYILAETEEENAFAFEILERELNLPVPTERLRAKVFGSIADIEERKASGLFGRLFAQLGFQHPGVVGAAGALVATGVIAALLVFPGAAPDRGDMAVNRSEKVVEPVTRVGTAGPLALENTAAAGGSESVAVPALGVSRRKRKSARNRPHRSSAGGLPVTLASANITSEETFLQTIATLDSTVESSKQFFDATERIAFEKDLAIVNNAIAKMKDEVRRNPNNKAAREVLSVSYQNKIELLNSAAEKTELMASLR